VDEEKLKVAIQRNCLRYKRLDRCPSYWAAIIFSRHST